MRRPESLLQEAIVAYLRAVLPRSVMVHSVPNGLHTSKASGAIAVREGLLEGVPDLMLVRSGGSAAYIEVKAGKGRLSPAQQAMIAWCQENGVPVTVARSIEDVRGFLASLSIPTREAA